MQQAFAVGRASRKSEFRTIDEVIEASTAPCRHRSLTRGILRAARAATEAGRRHTKNSKSVISTREPVVGAVLVVLLLSAHARSAANHRGALAMIGARRAAARGYVLRAVREGTRAVLVDAVHGGAPLMGRREKGDSRGIGVEELLATRHAASIALGACAPGTPDVPPGAPMGTPPERWTRRT